MTEGKKALEFKHAHITGQAMRDHWGPIVERIAAETADWRDAWIYDLITENERLREHIARQANTINIVGSPYHRAMEALDEIVSSVKREARAALKEIDNGDR